MTYKEFEPISFQLMQDVLRTLTNTNQHTMARSVLITTFLPAEDGLCKELYDIIEKEEELGYLTPALFEKRYSITARALDKIAETFGAEVVDKLKACL